GEAADLLRISRMSSRDGMVGGTEASEHLFDDRFLIADELALGLALLRMAEWIKRRPAQELEFRNEHESGKDPRAEGHLFRLAGKLVRARKQGRGEENVQTQMIAAQLVPDLICKAAIGIEPRHFVLVLVGHELEQVARHRL